MFMERKRRWMSMLSSQNLVVLWKASLLPLWMTHGNSHHWLWAPHLHLPSRGVPLACPVITLACNFRATQSSSSKSIIKIRVATCLVVVKLWKKNLRKRFIASLMNGPTKEEKGLGLIWMTNLPQPNFQFPSPHVLMIFQLSVLETTTVNY